MLWLQLRERRGSMPDRSSLMRTSVARRKTFAAAMQQFEEQMTAAKVVTSATSPINLYYGLAQAGTAIAAAKAPERWSVSSHGLTLVDTDRELADIRVQLSGSGAFQMVADSTGSSGIVGSVPIGKLWQSLPELCNPVPLPGADYLAALHVIPETPPDFDATGSGMRTRVLFFQPPGATVLVPAPLPDLPDREEWCRELMLNYPSAEGWNPDSSRQWFTDESGELPLSSIILRVPGSPAKYPLPNSEAAPLFDRLAPEYRHRDDRYMRPRLEDGSGQAPSPLMTWWLLLYSFSMLARYQPRKWTDLLNLDKRGCATQIQYALESALTVLPHLVLEALDHRQILLTNNGHLALMRTTPS